MRAIGISFLLLLTGFCFGIPEGACSPHAESATGARLHLDEHYTGAVAPGAPPIGPLFAEQEVHPVPVVDEGEASPAVDAVSPGPFPPFRFGKPLLVLCGIVLLPAVYFLWRKGAEKKIPLLEFSGTPAPSLPSGLPPGFPETPGGKLEGFQSDLEGNLVGSDFGEVFAPAVPEKSSEALPEEKFSLARIRCKAAETGQVDVGHLMVLLESVCTPYDHSRLIYWMGRLGVKEALPRFLRELAHPDASVRMAAAAALVHLRNDRVEDRMIEMAGEPDPHVRKAALLVLSRIGSTRCYEVVRKSCWDFEPEVRESAAIALGRLQVPDAGPDLRQILGDFEEEVRLRAVRASAQLCGGLQQEGG